MCGCGNTSPCFGCTCGCDHGTEQGLRKQVIHFARLYTKLAATRQ